MKLHFTSPDEIASKSLISALIKEHEISTSVQLEGQYDAIIVGQDKVKQLLDQDRLQQHSANIWSVPDLVRELASDKQRVVVAGSNDKSRLTSCVLHVLHSVGKAFDYFTPQGIQLSKAPLIIIEGSAENSSAYDPEPEFLKYHHHIALITQLNHEYEDLYPTFDEYVSQFDKLADATPKGGSVIYCEDDDLVTVIGGKERPDIRNIPYTSYEGDLNIGAAYTLLKRFSVTDEQFAQALKSYKDH